MPLVVIVVVVGIFVVATAMELRLLGRSKGHRLPDRPLPRWGDDPSEFVRESLDPDAYDEAGRDLVRRRLSIALVAFGIAALVMVITFIRAI